MKTLYNSSNYGNDLKLTRRDAENASHSGDCESDVLLLMEKKYIKSQLDLLEPEQLKKELSDYGAWDDEQLSDHKENLKRWIWISAGDIVERT